MVNTTELIYNMVSLIRTLWPPQAVVSDGCEYDFVIVGSGAGSVLANRLSERCDCSILLIEAGGNPSDDSRIPAQFPFVTNSPMDWNFASEVEPATASQEINRFKVSAGKVLGGSAVINHLHHIRGVPEDFDYIAELLNDSSWSYYNMLHYFKKSENYKDETIMNSEYNVFHGSKGPMNISRQILEISRTYMNAFAELGYPINPDLNSNNLTGYGFVPYTIDLVRQDPAGTYILAARDRPNLHILRNAFVTKVNIEEKLATGVEVDLENGISVTIHAKKEVLVCAGTINSPKLLMLSGIGPRSILEEHGIPVIVDLPVGWNMQDHVTVPIVHKMDYSTVPPTPITPDQLFPMFIGSVIVDNDTNIPQYQNVNAYFEHDLPSLMVACSLIFNMRPDICEMYVSESVGRNTMFSLITIYNPYSRGYVAIQSADPYVNPIIKMNYYDNSKDFTDMVRYIENFLHINNSTLFKKLGAEVVHPKFPNCTSSYWECYAMANTVNLYHITSTCPMGTVLDSNAKVKGIRRLRVVDGSTLPKIPTANPLAAIIALAEKISDVIKNDHSYC